MAPFGKFRELVRRGKDLSTSIVLEKVIRDRLARYGKVSNFDLDSGQKSLRLEILPFGESDPVKVVVEEYALIEDGNAVQFVVRRATASRPWIQRLIEDFVLNKAFPIPEKYGRMAKIVM